MNSFNSCTIIGNVGEMPSMRFTPSGSAVTTFNVAVNHKYKDKSGELKEDTNWFSVVCWNRTAELTNQYLNKGSGVFITGRLSNRNWTSEDGVKHYKTEIIAEKVIFLDAKNNGKVAQPEAESGGDVEPNDIPF
jgi:single-strand DNA-binding protein